MKNSMIKVTVNVIKSKSPISFNNRNTTTSPLQASSNPMILSSSIKNPLPLSKSIPKDINTLLKLSTDETPTFDVESSETSSFLTKPQIQLNTKPRILSVIWTGKSKEQIETKTICPYESTSAPVDTNNNTKCKVNYATTTKQDDDEDVSNFLNYKLGDINNDNDSESIILGALNNFNDDYDNTNNNNNNGMRCQSQIQKYNKCNSGNNNINNNSNNNINIVTSKSNNFHLIAKYVNVNKNMKNQHLYKNSSLKEMEFDLSNLSPQLFSVDDFNTSYSRSIYNNDISEMKPNENINNVYMMNTCFTFSNQRNYNMLMNKNNVNGSGSGNNKAKIVATKCVVNEQKKKVMNGFNNVNKSKNTITTKRCQTNPSTRVVTDKSKMCGSSSNNNNNNSNTHVNSKGINLKKSCNNINKKVNNNMKSSYVSSNTINNMQKGYKQNNNVTVIKYKNSNNNGGKGNNNLNCGGMKKYTKTASTNQKRNVGIFMKDYKQQPQTWEH